MAIDVLAPPAAAVDDLVWIEDGYRQAVEAYTHLVDTLSEGDDRDELLHIAVAQMCELVGVSRCSLFLRDEEGDLYRGQVVHAAGATDAPVKRMTAGFEADGFTQEIVRSGGPVVLADALRDPRAVHSTMRTWRIRSIMGVPMVFRGRVIGIIFLDSEDTVHDFSRRDQELSFAFAKLVALSVGQREVVGDLRASSAAVERQNQVLRRAAAVDDRLTGLVLGGGGLGEIATVVSELTNKCVALCDPEFRLLAAGGHDADLDPEIDQAVLSSPRVAEEIASRPADKPAVLGPFPDVGIQVRLLVTPVRVAGVDWAKVILFERKDTLNAFDMLISRRVAGVVALEMSAERRAAQAEWNARAALASDLIHGSREIGQLTRRAIYLGLSLDQPHAVALLRPSSQASAEQPGAEAVAAAIADLAADTSVLATATDEGVAVILDLPQEGSSTSRLRQIKRTIAAACGQLAPDGGLIAAVSMQCPGPSDFAPAYEQVRMVIRCLDTHRSAGGPTVLGADDLGAGRLLLLASKAEVARFTEETIGPLLAQDTPRELIETLLCFFDHRRSVRQSALCLDVHENTVRYRLARIKELTGCDFAFDSDAQVSAQVALIALRLHGDLPLPEPTDA